MTESWPDDCTFDTYVVPRWNSFATTPAREYFARKRATLDMTRATPFLGDNQSRATFTTVQTRDVL